jgi:hypothetical protein
MFWKLCWDKTVFPRGTEDMLFNYCMDMVTRYFGFPAVYARRLAYQLAIRNGLPNQFSNDRAATENKWVNELFGSHPRLSMRLPYGISAAR